MAYVSYVGLTNSNEVLEGIADYVTAQGYTIVQPLVDDLDVYTLSVNDGKKFCFQDATQTYYIVLRSANNYNIFGVNDDPTMDVTTPQTGSNYTGIGMTVGEGYSSTQRWYNQFRVPLAYNSASNWQSAPTDVLGVYMPIKVGSGYSYTLYCNRVTEPSDTLVFSIVKENDNYRQCTHLVVGNLKKFGNQLEDALWEGGLFFSGSATRYMPNANSVFDHNITSDSAILPILSSGDASNTFLRIDIDNAPSEARHNILWASSGTDNITGKPMSLPIRTGTGKNGNIPHYYYLQSKSRLDWGRNINTLNCLTIDMPLYVAVRTDPDSLNQYAAVGLVSGIYFISTLNMQTAKTYERDYPASGKRAQIFPFGKRRGYYGFDGFSIRQELADAE